MPAPVTAKPKPTFGASKPISPLKQGAVRTLLKQSKPKPYIAPKNAPGVTDLATAVTYANAHGNTAAGPGVGVTSDTTPPPAPTPAAPSVPGVQPFHTGGQIMDAATHNADVTTQLGGIDRNLADTTTNITYAKTQLLAKYKQAAADTADAMAARGIFRSSVSDGAQFDLTGQKAIQQGLLDDQLANAQTAADNAKLAINNANADWMKGYNQLGVENAESIPPTLPTTTPPTTTAPPATAPTTKPPGSKPPTKPGHGKRQVWGRDTVKKFGKSGPAGPAAGLTRGY